MAYLASKNPLISPEAINAGRENCSSSKESVNSRQLFLTPAAQRRFAAGEPEMASDLWAKKINGQNFGPIISGASQRPREVTGWYVGRSKKLVFGAII